MEWSWSRKWHDGWVGGLARLPANDGRTTREHGSTWRRCGGETPGGVCRHCVPPADCRSPPLLNGYVSPWGGGGFLTTQHTVYCLHAGCQCSEKSTVRWVCSHRLSSCDALGAFVHHKYYAISYIALLLEYKARWSRYLYFELIVTPRYPTGIDLYALATRFSLCILRHCLFVLYRRRLWNIVPETPSESNFASLLCWLRSRGETLFKGIFHAHMIHGLRRLCLRTQEFVFYVGIVISLGSENPIRTEPLRCIVLANEMERSVGLGIG